MKFKSLEEGKQAMCLLRRAASSTVRGLQEKRRWKRMEDERGQGRRVAAQSATRKERNCKGPPTNKLLRALAGPPFSAKISEDWSLLFTKNDASLTECS